MKKALIIFITIFVVLIIALAAIPLFCKSTLLEKTKVTINNQINAKIDFEGFDLSLFKGFPKVALELENVTVTGVDEFENDTLLKVSSLMAKMSLMQLFNKDGMGIDEVYILRPDLKLIVKESGAANWDLAKGPAGEGGKKAQTAETDDESSGFNIQLDKIEIEDANVFYIDKQADVALSFEDVGFDINGAMYGTSAKINVEGKVVKFTTEYGGTQYITNTSLSTKILLDIDYDKMDISIQGEELYVNDLPLQINGTIQIPSDSMFFDLELSTKESGLENFLALVPADYSAYLKDFKTSGSATITGKVSGLYYEENYPAFSLNVNVDNGNLHYADFPEDIKNIGADISVNKPQGELDLMEVNIKKAHAEIRENPLDMSLALKRLVSDPYFDGSFSGKLDFAQVKDAIPLDSVNISGKLEANLSAKGNYSSIEKEQYDKIKSVGKVLLENFVYESVDLSQPVYVTNGQLDFSPKDISLTRFNMKVGQSDFNLDGKVGNYLNYIFKDGKLSGNLKLNSNFVNINELLLLQVESEEVQEGNETSKSSGGEDTPVTEALAFDIPDNIDFTFGSEIKKALFNKIDITAINGLIYARNGKLTLDGLDMDMLDGGMKITGSYQNTPENRPLFDFSFDIDKFDIPLAFRSLSGIQNIMPVAGKSTGNLSANIQLGGSMDEQLTVATTSLNGKGLFSTENLQINNSDIFDQLKGILKSEKLKKVKVDDFKTNFTVKDGNLLLQPFKTKIAGQETEIEGSLNAQNLLNMKMGFNIQREAFGPDIQSILNAIPGNKNITVVPAGVILNGPVGKPEVKLDLSDTRKTITDATKGELQKSLNKLGEGLNKLFK